MLNEGRLEFGAAIGSNLFPHLVNEEIQGSLLHIVLTSLHFIEVFSLVTIFFAVLSILTLVGSKNFSDKATELAFEEPWCN